VTVGNLDQIEQRVTAEVDAAAELALQSRGRIPAPESALGGVYVG
jgi:TPP-dependent pyruvate/acetoin dehydrogenase alpha subunit